jgi:hypothetical protein
VRDCRRAAVHHCARKFGVNSPKVRAVR